MENYKDISKRITDHLIASDKSFLYSHQISSFNHFISELIPNVVENYGPIKLYGNYNEDAQKYENLIEISFSNVTFHSPAHYNSNGVLRVLMPETAKLNNHNYSSDLHVDINILRNPRFVGPKGNVGYVKHIVRRLRGRHRCGFQSRHARG